jgi:tetratricopeptide (TPR) repeat protein
MERSKQRKRAVRRAQVRRAQSIPLRPPRRAAAALALLVFLVPAALLGWRKAAALRRSPARIGMAVNPGGVAPPGARSKETRLRGAVGRRPADPGAHLELARFCADQGQAAEAAWEYQEAATLLPEAIPAQVGLAAALGQLRQHGLAIAGLEQQLRRQPRAVDLRRALAELYLATGRPERGAAALAADPVGVQRSPEALLVLGRTQLALGDPSAAQAAFQAQIRRAPQSAEGAYWLGRAAWISGRAQMARRCWKRASQLAPQDPRFPCCLGMSYARDPAPGSVDRAGQAFDEALSRSPGYVPALLQLGLLFQRHGQPREAARRFLDAIDRAPTDPEPHRRLAEVLSALGETAEAHRQQGLYYSLSDQPALALAEYSRFQAAAPASLDGPLLISQSDIQMQQNGRAASVVEAALRRYPREPALFERLGTLDILTQSRIEARRVGEAWLRAQPDSARPHWLLGRVALGNHQVEEAVRQFEAALTRDPGEADYSASLTDALAREPAAASQQRALSLLRRAVALKPGEPEYHHQLGVQLLKRREWEDARREFLATLSLDADRTSAYYNLVQLSEALRRPGQVALWAAAIQSVQDRLSREKLARRQAGRRPRDPAPYYALAEILLEGGELAKAQSQLEQALLLQPRWPAARRLLDQVTALRAVL